MLTTLHEKSQTIVLETADFTRCHKPDTLSIGNLLSEYGMQELLDSDISIFPGSKIRWSFICEPGCEGDANQVP